ncbi:integrase [Ursidibacter arcticus]|uniref:tyrosine-type recombinase/integrase n=1 Tax=Ursidibacter arcticus TaxID=1524965 RepID=UPI0012FB9765|nr:tyrosine-type recombinase/integrase [Ursidibacter arcticus]KAE9531837.1 integrase [Ursidibacter arcticus]
MAKTVKPLNELKIKNLKPKDKEYSLADGNNLYLSISPQNAKVWRFIYVHPISKKRQKKTLGTFPFMRLAEAREIARHHKTLLLKNIDPFEYIEQQKREQEQRDELFSDFAYKWADWKQSKGKYNEETKNKTLKRLENHLFPRFVDYRLNQFTITDTIEKLQDLETVKSDTLQRTLGNLIEILDYAMLCGRIPHNPVTPIKKAFATVASTHQPTIKPEELAEFMQMLQKSNRTPQIKLLIEWQLVTMLRPFEASAVQWSDIDWENKILSIPAERMKGGKRGHCVPLSSQALQILEEIRLFNGNYKHVFAGRNDRSKPTNSQTVNNAIKRIERGKYSGILTAHGLRSIASTYLNERFTEEPFVIEACLAHVGADTVRNAYFRGSYLERRRAIMQAWGDFVEQCKKAK